MGYFVSSVSPRRDKKSVFDPCGRTAALFCLLPVVYALSPFQQKIMGGLWKDLPGKISHKVSENWISATLLLAPLVGTYTYVQNFKEKEKLEHRY